MAKDGVTELTREWLATRETHRPYHTAVGLEYEYSLKLKQHDPKLAAGRMKVVSLDVTDIVRYNSAEIAGTSIYLDVESDSPAETPQAQAEQDEMIHAVRTAFHRKVHSLDIGYPRVRRRVVRMACAARMGAAVLEIVSDCGKIAIVPRVRDPRDFTWDARFPHFNDHGCPKLFDRQRLTLEEIEVLAEEQGWDKAAVKALKPDNGKSAQDVPENLSGAALEEWQALHPDYTIVTCWDKSEAKTIEVEETRKLEPEDWFMSCSKCGYTEKDLAPSEEYDGSLLEKATPCPQCGVDPEGKPVSMMIRNEAEIVSKPALLYNNGYVRRIFAPFSPEAGYLLEKPWPRGLTNFPVMVHITDPYPIEPSGNSDTFLHMSMHGLKNFALRESAEQFARNRDVTIVNEELVTDEKGEPYQWDGSGPYVGFTSERDNIGSGIYHHQGSGISAAAPVWIGMINKELMSYRGIDEMSTDPATLKGTPVGSMVMAKETGRVPLDERIRIFREDEEQLLNRWLEMLVGNSDENEWVNAQKADGTREWRKVMWSSLTGMTVRVIGKPRFDFVDKANMETLEKLAPLAQISPALFRTLAASSNLPSSTVEQVLKDFSMMMPPGAPAGPGGPVPGGGAAGVPRGEDLAPPVPPGIMPPELGGGIPLPPGPMA